MRKELTIGLLIYGITMITSQFISLPEFVMGLLMGLAICFELTGLINDRAYEKLKNDKKTIFRKQ